LLPGGGHCTSFSRPRHIAVVDLQVSTLDAPVLAPALQIWGHGPHATFRADGYRPAGAAEHQAPPTLSGMLKVTEVARPSRGVTPRAGGPRSVSAKPP